MKIAIVEDNLAGFLTGVYHSYYSEKDIEIVASDVNFSTLLDTAITYETDLELARKVRTGIIKKAGITGYSEVADAYRSGAPMKEQVIFRYLKLLFVKGGDVASMYADERVIAFNDTLRKVRGEAHRLTGFIRFRETENGVFYGYFGADNDILELLLPHFTSRFNNQQFVLHDIKRKKLAFYDGSGIHLIPAPEGVNIAFTPEEEVVSRLWKQYHHNVSIENRKNIRQQDHFLPKKYRFFMNEF